LSNFGSRDSKKAYPKSEGRGYSEEGEIAFGQKKECSM